MDEPLNIKEALSHQTACCELRSPALSVLFLEEIKAQCVAIILILFIYLVTLPVSIHPVRIIEMKWITMKRKATSVCFSDFVFPPLCSCVLVPVL